METQQQQANDRVEVSRENRLEVENTLLRFRQCQRDLQQIREELEQINDEREQLVKELLDGTDYEDEDVMVVGTDEDEDGSYLVINTE